MYNFNNQHFINFYVLLPFIRVNDFFNDLSEMLKQLVALFFITIGSIILLANVVFPHHHHESEVCIVNTHCESENGVDKHDTNKHDHDGDNSVEHCILNPVFLVPVNQVKQEIKSLDFSDNKINHKQLQTNSIDFESISLLPTYLNSTNPPLIFFSYCHYASNCLGMRAPPIV